MGLGGRVARFAIRQRRGVLVCSLALSTASLLSLTTLRLDVDLLTTLPSGKPAFDEYRDLLATFGATQTLPVLVSGVTGPALGRAIDALAARYRSIPEITAVRAGFDRTVAAPYLDPVHAPALVPAEHLPELAARLEPRAIASALARLKAILAVPTGGEIATYMRHDPLGLALVVAASVRDRYADPVASATDPHILAPGGNAGLVLVDPAGSPFDAEFTAALFTALAAAEAAVRATDPRLAGLRIAYAGAYAHAHEDASLIQGDVLRYTLLTLAGVIAIFALGYHTLAILPLVGYLLFAGSLLAFGASVLIYHQLNALSLSFAAIFYGLAIDSGIHFYSRLAEERRRAPLEEAVIRTCDGIGAANVVASTTTAAAFAVIACSAMAAVRQIGVLTTLGMLANIVHTFLLLPALTTAFSGRLASRPPPPQEMALTGAAAGMASRHPFPVLAIAALIVGAWIAAPSVPVDAEILHLRPRRSAATAAEDAIAASFDALAPRGAAIVTGTDLEAALIREEQVVAWLESHRVGTSDSAAAPEAATARGGTEQGSVAPAVIGYQALSTFLPSQATERARRSAFAALPLDAARRTLRAELARQGFRAAAFADAERALAPGPEMLPRDLDAPWLAPLVSRHVRRSAEGVKLLVTFTPAPGTSLALLRDRLRAEVDPAPVVTGRPLMQAALAAVIAHEAIVFTVVTLVLNVAIVLLQVRAIGLALVLMAPTVVIVLALLGGMRLAGVAFTPINLIVLPLALAIGVDDCVYLAARWREGHDASAAARLVGRAITLTTLTTMTGFGFLAVSRYPGLAGLGWLAAVAIGLTFVAAIVVLPALLAILPRGGTGTRTGAAEP
jgi:predicted RND superfamily exporter protein